MVRISQNKKRRNKEGGSERVFTVWNYIFVTGIALTMIYPLINVLSVSLSDYYEYLKNPGMVLPKGITLEGYKYVLADDLFWKSYLNSIIVVFAGTVHGLVITILTAYPLSRRVLKGKAIFMGLIIFTMVFTAGMIPLYLNIKELKLLNTLWVLIIPGGLSAFNVILMLNSFREIPIDLIEAAEIDGASEPFILSRIVVPLSKAVIASISLFLAVGYWNNYFDAQIYIRDREKWTLALTLKEILLSANTELLNSGGDPAAMAKKSMSTSLQYACIVISTLPIMCVYPFLQKYFAKGVMVGSVKG